MLADGAPARDGRLAGAASRAALERLGARFEGVHRKQRIVPGLGVRDTAWYSVLDDEWPAVRAALRARLAAGSVPGYG